MTEFSISQYFLGKKGIRALLTYHYRFFFPALFILITIGNYLQADHGTLTHTVHQLYLSIPYVAYLIAIEMSKYRLRHPGVVHRIIRVNIDLIYISAAYLLLPRGYEAVSMLFVIPIISALNYRQNRYYYVFATFILIYIIFVEINLAEKPMQYASITVNIFIYISLFYAIATVLYLFDKNRYDIENYATRIKQFYQSVRLSDYYSNTLKNLLLQLRNVTQVDLITLDFYDQQANELFAVDAVGDVNKHKVPRQSVKIGVVGECFRTGKPIIVDNVMKYKDYFQVEESTRSELAMPIKINNKTIGVMNFESKQEKFFDAPLMRIIDVVHEHVVALLRNAFEVYNTERNLIEKIDEYRENSLFVRELAHEMRNALLNLIQLPEYLNHKETSKWDFKLVEELTQIQLETFKRFRKALNKAIEARDIYTPKVGAVRIGQLFEEIESRLFFRVTKSLIEVESDVQPGIDEKEMLTDNEYVASIITNVIDNSINAYEKSKDADSEASKFNIVELERRIDANDENLIVIIRDKAGGIPENLALKMSDSSMHTAGTRTGLNIIKRYISALNGIVKYKRIMIDDKLGTEVFISLPTKRKKG